LAKIPAQFGPGIAGFLNFIQDLAVAQRFAGQVKFEGSSRAGGVGYFDRGKIVGFRFGGAHKK
jgi:hypothetical protein